MPVDYVRQLTAPVRTNRENTRLGTALAFVAGATNAGAFLVVKQYTSHMTGIVSQMAGAVVQGQKTVFITGLSALIAFIAGAGTTAVIVNAARRRRLNSAYALPLLVEAVLLLAFGVMGARMNQPHPAFGSLAVILLCFTMGLQNATITKISHAEIRTTHVTGLVTDLGIELGKLFYVNGQPFEGQERVVADRERLRLLMVLLAAFFIGGVFGVWGFQATGYLTTVPLALVLVILAAVPAFDDIRHAMR